MMCQVVLNSLRMWQNISNPRVFGLLPVLVGLSPFLTLQVCVGKVPAFVISTVFVLETCRNGETDTELKERKGVRVICRIIVV